MNDVIYRSSQPWPFPASVMIGFHAEAESMEFSVNESELESARWLSREELRPENMPKDGSFFMPRRDFDRPPPDRGVAGSRGRRLDQRLTDPRTTMTAQLFTPVELGGVTLPNRIVVSPMCQ